MKFTKAKCLKGQIQVPGDKSISHRAIMLGSLAKGKTEITNFLQGADCLSSMACFQNMGIEIINQNNSVIVHGKGEGIVKDELQFILKNDKRVKRYYLDMFNIGETIIELN